MERLEDNDTLEVGSHGLSTCVPRPRLIVAALIGVCIMLGCASSAMAATAEEGRIAGRVTDAATQAGIEGLEVCARSRSDRFGGYCARTGQNGEYTISEVPAGSYVVEFLVSFFGGPNFSPGGLDYASQYYDDRARQTEAEEVTVTAGDTTGGIDAAMRPGGQITGVATDAVTHDPIAGIDVCAYMPLATEDPPSRCAVTNADGEYAVYPLISGSYVVEFTAPSNGALDYARQYYNDQVSAEQANEVPVTAGETTSGIDAAMQPGGNITGRVTVAATGGPLVNADVCAFSMATLSVGNTTPERCAETNSNGEYVLQQLTAGQDIVEFRDEFGAGFVRQYWDDKPSLAEADPFAVTPGITTIGVNAAMAAVGEQIVKPPSPTEISLSTDFASPTPLVKMAPLVTIATSQLVVSHGTAQVRVACSGAACQGSIELVARVAMGDSDGGSSGGDKLARSGTGIRDRTGKTAGKRPGNEARERGTHVKTLVLATGSFSLEGGHSGSVLLHLTPAGRRRLAHARHHRLAARLVLSVNGGGTVSRAVGVG